MLLAATRTRADAVTTAAAGFVALLLSWGFAQALASRLFKDRSVAPNQSASKCAAKFLPLARNKNQRQPDGNHIFANGGDGVFNARIAHQPSPDVVPEKGAGNAAYST